MNRPNLIAAILCCASSLATAAHGADDLTLEQEQFFESKIRPVLVRECYGCHSNQTGNARGGLKLDTEQLLHIGGSTGPAIVPGNLEESLLYSAITYDDFEMPPKRKLSPSVIADFRRWIEMGAPDPRKSEITETKSAITDRDIELAQSTFWSYQPIAKPSRPEVEQQNWCRSEVDAFVLAALETNELSPSKDADPHQVLRRLCFDIVGLPPTVKQIDAFERMWQADPQRAVEHVVDRLLESEQYGERWGRHWLDVARYAESTGREVNVTYPHAWRYRDFVIDSFNEDKPFDQFVRQQIAGDLLSVDTDQQWTENLIATTFLAVGAKNVNEQNRVQFAADLVDEQIDATTRVFLGMSVACARCHDHKFDAIRQSDYYALAGLFDGMTTYFGNPPSELGTFSPAQRKRNSSLIRLPIDDPNPYDRRYAPEELEQLKEEIRSTISGGALGRRPTGQDGNMANALQQRLATLNRLSDLTAKLAVVDENGQPISYCMGVQQRDDPADVRLLARGEIDQPAQVVPRGVPSVIADRVASQSGTPSDRKDLADWIASPDNPLTARVMVNRIWQHLLGSGIVPSTENFGVTGQTPSHPELLDYLAVEFVESGWSVKHVVRLIATSRIYRTSSTHNEEYHQVDPENRLLWRANVRRLEAEALRDAMLSVGGRLDLERPRGSEVAKAGFTTVREGILGDPREKARQQMEKVIGQMRGSVRSRRGRMTSQQRQDMIADATRGITNELDMEDATFRSVYLPIVRNEVPRSLEVFDFAPADTITGQRETSQTSNQALFMMNNPFVVDCSNSFANRLLEIATKPVDQLDLAFKLAFARSPTRSERLLASQFVRDYVQHDGELSATAALCQSLFAAAEFRLVE